MASVMSALKDEITRLSRKEVKAAVMPLRKTSAAARKTLTELKRRVEALDREVAALRRRTCPTIPAAKAAAPEKAPAAAAAAKAEPKARITARTVKALRKKLKLPVTQFAKLVGVTPKWVYMWESKQGPLRMRTATREAILEARSMGIREAAKRLEELNQKQEA